MKNSIYIAICLIFLLATNLQTTAQNIYSNYLLNPLGNWTAGIAIFHKNDTVYFSATGENSLGRAMLIGKLDINGEISYQKTYQDPLSRYTPTVGSFAPITDSSYIVMGTNVRGSEYKGFIFQLDRNLDTTNVSYLKVENFELILRDFKKLQNGEFIITGEVFTNMPPPNYPISEGVILFKTDINGNILWHQLYKPDIRTLCTSVTKTSDKGFAIGGYTNSNTDYSGQPMVIKTDSLGNEEWIWRNGSQFDDMQATCTLANDGHMLIAYGHATYQAPPHPVPPALTTIRVIKLNNAGDMIWSKDYGGSYTDNEAYSITPLDDGTYIVGGHTWTTDFDSAWVHSYLLKINEVGDSLWMRYYIHEDDYPSQFNLFSDISIAPDKSILFTGYYQNFLTSVPIKNMWIMRLDSLGCDTPECNPFVGIKKPGIMKEEQIQIYPNPAKQYIEIEMPDAFITGQILLPLVRFYDTSGKLAAEMKPEKTGATFRCNVETMKPGVYFVQLIDRNCILGSSKLLILR